MFLSRWCGPRPHDQWIVPAENTLALRDAIANLIADPALGAQLGAAARGHCLENYSLERMLTRMEGIFASIDTNVRKFPREDRAA